MKMWLQSVVLFALLGLVVSAQEISLEMDEVVARYDGEQKIELSGTTATRYIPMDKSSKNLDLADVIARQPAVKSQKYGAQGSFSTVSIRGTDGKRVAVFVDGVLQNSAVGGAVDLSAYSGLDIKGIKVYRGVVPADLGGNSLGGAINIITNSGGENRASISLLTGSFGEFRGIGSLSHNLSDKVNLFGSIDYHRSTNNYPYWDRNGTPYNPTDDTLRTLVNNKYVGGIGSLGANFYLKNERKIRVEWFHSDKTIGMPGGEWGKNQTANYSSRDDRFVVDYRRAFEGGNTYGQGLTYSVVADETFWTYLDHYGVAHGILGPNSVGRLSSKDYFLNYNLLSNISLGETFSVNSRFDLSAEQLVPQSDVDGYVAGYWDVQRLSPKLASDLTATVGGFEATVGGSVAWDFNHTDGGVDDYLGDTLQEQSSSLFHWSARVGVSQQLLSERLSVFANGNRYSRAPSLTELYGFTGGSLPNVDLLPESGVGFDGGVSVKFDKVAAELIYFHNYRENLIMMISDGVRSRSENITATLSYGLEQSILYNPLPWLSLEENLTLQHTENRQKMYEGNRLPNEPAFTLSGDIGLGSFAGFTLHTIGEYNSYYYRDMANAHRFPDEGSDKDGLFSLSFYLAWSYKGLTVEGSLINVTDDRKKSGAHQISSYSSMIYPGRRYQAQIKYSF